jgi:hypothetical protein
MLGEDVPGNATDDKGNRQNKDKQRKKKARSI